MTVHLKNKYGRNTPPVAFLLNNKPCRSEQNISGCLDQTRSLERDCSEVNGRMGITCSSIERPFDVKINTRSITSVLITNCDWPTKFPGL